MCCYAIERLDVSCETIESLVFSFYNRNYMKGQDMENIDFYHSKIKRFLDEKLVEYKHEVFDMLCHTVNEAAIAINESKDNFVKNICMIDKSGNLIVTIVSGDDRSSTKRVAKALGIDRPRLANSKEILEKTGFIAGGVPSFSYDAIYLLDEKILTKEYIITGGGSEYSLIKIRVKDMLKLNSAKICRVRK